MKKRNKEIEGKEEKLKEKKMIKELEKERNTNIVKKEGQEKERNIKRERTKGRRKSG